MERLINVVAQAGVYTSLIELVSSRCYAKVSPAICRLKGLHERCNRYNQCFCWRDLTP